MKPNDARLGYLLVASPVANVYIGGLMVVDGRGLPVEFRYTEPIQPTKIQQILYGSVLSRYIKTEVIMDSLLKSLECRPQILLVNDDNFLAKDVSNKDFEIVRITETKSGPLKHVGGIEKISSEEFLLQLTPESSPVRIQLAQNEVDSKLPSGGTKSIADKSKEPEVDFTSSSVYQILFQIGSITDILEPLGRVDKALSALCQEAGIKAVAS